MAFLLHQLLSRAASNDPDRAAVRCAGQTLRYRDLDTASNAIARTLIDAGVVPGDRVGIHLPKSVEAVVAVYGAMKAGAAYVPLDPRAPVPRIAGIAADCSVAALVTTPDRAPALLEALTRDSKSPRLVILVDDGNELAAERTWASISYRHATADRAATDPAVPVIDTDAAYILYTSGSTGVPKGVVLTHRNALTFVEWCVDQIGVRAGDRLSNHAPFHFDLSVFDLYVAAWGGATVVLVPEETAYMGPELARFIREEHITVWYSVPSALTLVTRVAGPGSFPDLRTVVFAGEVFPTKHLRALQRLVPEAALWNLYGPTETNVCTYYRVDELPGDDVTIPIGRACGNTEVFAVRDDGARAGLGEEGELYVRGSTVMKGYWGQPEKTAAVLVRNPLQPGRPDLVYRTGDLVRLRPDGNYDFLGRRDHQIKSRGYRIELGEIESVVSAHPSVAETVAVAVPHEEWGTAITVFVVARDGSLLTAAEVKRHVAGRLPRYMVPAQVEVVPSLPRTSTGKIDRPSLGELAVNGSRPLQPSVTPAAG